MSGQKTLPYILAEDRLSLGHDRGLGAAHIGKQAVGRKKRTHTFDLFDNCTHGSCQQHDLAAAHRLCRTGEARIDGSLGTCSIEHRLTVRSDDSSLESVLFQSQPERSADQTGPDDRDLANGHEETLDG